MADPKDVKGTDETQLSEDELKDVAGGANIQQRRLEHLDTQSKSVEDVQKTRLDQLDNSTK
ncbi:MAG: hypothetical protein WA885_16060 [Phormidesmis sp.]